VTDLSTLKKTISQTTTEGLRQQVVDIRSRRRAFPEKKATKKREANTQKVIGNASAEELRNLLKSLEDM